METVNDTVKDVVNETDIDAVKETDASAKPDGETQILMQVEDLTKFFPIRKGFFNRVHREVRAVDNVNFSINRGETVGLVGESGCGKSTIGYCLVRLYEPTSGKILFYQDVGEEPIDLAHADGKILRKARGDIQMIFQDPYSSLNPRMTARQCISEPMIIHKRERGSALEDRVAYLMEKVGLSPDYMNRYPHAFSGGQRQRIGIARALALNPRLMICDEAVSSLDVSVQAQILELLEELKPEFGMSYLFVAHDLSTVKYISDRVVVMYVGKIIETGLTEEIYNNPKHPYTEALLASVPKLKADKSERKATLLGEVPDPANPPPGCYFHPRCVYAIDECKEWTHDLLPSDSPTHFHSCLRADELKLKGVEY